MRFVIDQQLPSALVGVLEELGHEAIHVKALGGALVCNIGDMLERLTGGRFVSTPHRVVNRSDRQRLSFPFFYDPDFEAVMTPVPGAPRPASSQGRWDDADVHQVSGTYGDYLKQKVGRIFPSLRASLQGG